MFENKNQSSKSEVNVRKQKSEVQVMNELASAIKKLYNLNTSF